MLGDLLRPDVEGSLRLLALSQEHVAAILNDMSPDDRTELFEDLPGHLTQQLLTLLSPDERRIAVTLLGYPEESVGRLMTPEYPSPSSGWASIPPPQRRPSSPHSSMLRASSSTSRSPPKLCAARSCEVTSPKEWSMTPVMDQSSKAPSPRRLWLEDASGWLLPVAGIVVILAVSVLYLMDLLPEELTALAFAAAVCLVASGYVLRELLAGSMNARSTVLGLVAGIALLGASLTPAVITIEPGKALAQGTLQHPGDRMSLPQAASGPARLWVRGHIGPAQTAEVRFELSGGKEPIRGKLSRSTHLARAGRRGRTQVTDERNSEYVAAVILPGTEQITLAEIHGPLAGPLHVEVFRDYLPLRWELILAVLVLLAIAVLAARLGLRSSPVSVAGLALLFGVMVYEMATPDVAVRTEVGALIIGALAGSAVGTVAFWMAHRVVPAVAHSRTLT